MSDQLVFKSRYKSSGTDLQIHVGCGATLKGFSRVLSFAGIIDVYRVSTLNRVPVFHLLEALLLFIDFHAGLNFLFADHDFLLGNLDPLVFSQRDVIFRLDPGEIGIFLGMILHLLCVCRQ